MRVSDNYFLNDREEPLECKKIDAAHDWIKLRDKNECILIHTDTNLPNLLLNFKQRIYEPFVKYQAGTMLELKNTWKNKQLNKMIHHTIQSQNLSKSRIDEDVVVSSEEVH